MSLNKCMIIGNLGADVETRYTPGGTAVTNMRIATNEVFTNRSGETQKRTQWHRVVVWGKQAESCAKYLSKGRQVYVEGRLQTNKWTDGEGVVRYTTELVANRVQFLGGASKTASENQSASQEDLPGLNEEQAVEEKQELTVSDLRF